MADTQRNKTLIAILDDYSDPSNSLSARAFDDLLKRYSNLSLSQYAETLDTRTPEGLNVAIERYKPYEIICTMRERTPFPAELIQGLPNLKLLLTTASRNLAIDVKAANDAGVIVAGTGGKPGYLPDFESTNEHTWALILAAAKRIPTDDLRLKGGLPQQGDWQYGMNVTLAGKTLGLLGLGKLGVQCAATGKLGFGMNILAWSENLTQAKADQAAAARDLPKGSFKVAASKEDLFRNADVLSVHYVLSERSRGIVGKQELMSMKQSAILVNTSRGPLVDEVALFEALEAGSIRAVGVDVFNKEPLPKDSRWRSPSWDSKVVVSPHMGYVEEEIMLSWYQQQSDNVEKFLQGKELSWIIKP